MRIDAGTWLASLAGFAASAAAAAVQIPGAETNISPRADPNLVGYLGAFFLGADPYVYFYLSDGNDPVSYKALNKGQPVIKPTLGTRGVRDPTIVAGGGSEAGKKYYIIGTDLNIGSTTWDIAQRNGSRSIYVWDSTDLVNWGNERLVSLEDKTAGMVWAPEALWDASKNKYMVYWSSKFYATSDPGHTGNPGAIMIRYAHTSDFRTFTAPATYVSAAPTNIIDMTILPLNDGKGTLVRFTKDETAKTVFTETTTGGVFGTWTRVGGSNAIIQSGVEGPAAFLDNQVAGKVHVLLDHYGSDGYRPYESMNAATSKDWTASNRNNFPKNLRHGSILPVTQAQYNAVKNKWG